MDRAFPYAYQRPEGPIDPAVDEATAIVREHYQRHLDDPDEVLTSDDAHGLLDHLADVESQVSQMERLAGSIPGVIPGAVRTALGVAKTRRRKVAREELREAALQLARGAVECAAPGLPEDVVAEHAPRFIDADAPAGPGFQDYMKEVFHMPDDKINEGKDEEPSEDEQPTAPDEEPTFEGPDEWDDEDDEDIRDKGVHELGARLHGIAGLTTQFLRGVSAPRTIPPGAGPRNALLFSRRLTLLHFGYLEAGIGEAASRLAESLLRGDVDLCDDDVVQLAWARQKLVDLGLPPTPEQMATAAAKLGFRSGWTPPGARVAAQAIQFRSAIWVLAHDIVCGKRHEATCARTKLPALLLAFRDYVDGALTGADRAMISRATPWHAFDTALLRHRAVVASYGDSCGNDTITVSQRILGRPPRDAVGLSAATDAAQQFHRLLLVPPGGNLDAAARNFVTASLRTPGGAAMLTAHVGDVAVI